MRRPALVLRRFGLLLAAGALCTVHGASWAQPDLERKVKSAFIYNFAKFVSWPDSSFSSPQAPFTICATEPKIIDTLRDVVAGKTVGERGIQVLPAGSSGCQIVYVPGADAEEVQRVLDGQPQPGILTVYETDRALDNGVVRFFMQDRKVRLEIDREAAAAADLSISSKLLRVASLRNS